MTVRRLEKSWQYDFKAPGSNKRHRQAGFRTKAEALAAEKRAREEVISGHRRILFADAYQAFLDASDIQDRTRDTYQSMWPHLKPVLAHLYIEEVTTTELDTLKQALPKKFGPRSINKHLTFVGTVLRFMWKRQHLKSLPYIPKVKEVRKPVEWYSTAERDAFLAGMFEHYPQWFLFFYTTMRLGLRTGEVYALARSRTHLTANPARILIDRAVQKGHKEREAELKPRKNNEAYTVEISSDIVTAIEWHIERGYSGSEFYFSESGKFPKYLDSHKLPQRNVQRALGLRELSHHRLGRHSVGSQAAEMGHTLKAIQAQLGHRTSQSTVRYLHASDRAKLRLVTGLAPSAPPHVNHRSTSSETEVA